MDMPGMAVVVAIEWDWVFSLLVVWLVTTGLTWVVAAKITSAVLKTHVTHLAAAIETIDNRTTENAEKIAELDKGRSRCELRAAQTYASHREVAQIVSDNTSQWLTLMKKMEAIGSETHGRITRVAERLSAVEGRLGEPAQIPRKGRKGKSNGD